MTLVKIPSEVLIDFFDPLNGDPWGVGDITPALVAQALSEGRLRDNNPYWSDTCGTSNDHVERIAWLVYHGWNLLEPLEIEVSECDIAYLNDGNHRLYALAFAGVDCQVSVSLSGFLDFAEDLFGIAIS